MTTMSSLHMDTSDLLNVTNNTSTPSPELRPISSLQLAILAAIQTVVAVVILIGNGLVLVAGYRYPNLRSPANVFVFHLAVADLLAGVVGIPANVTAQMLIYHNLEKLYWLCLLKYYPFAVALGASGCLLVGLSVDRYICIHNPLHYHVIMTARRAKLICVSCWSFSAIWHGLELGIHALRFPSHICEFFYVFSMTYILTVIAFFFSIIVTLATINTKLLITVRRAIVYNMTMRHSGEPPPTTPARKASILRINPRNARATKTAVVVVGCFVACVVPWVILISVMLARKHMGGFYDHGWLYKATVYVGNTMLVLNSAFNPIIYHSRVAAFRRAFRKILHLNDPPPKLKPVSNI